jgi:nitric oxide synthase oxygenase domain/subunit
MNNIPPKLKEKLSKNQWYYKCCRADKECLGRITWEHSYIYSGRQIQEEWAILPLCLHHHLGTGLDKRINHWISINRMTKKDELKYPKFNWARERLILNKKYGRK